MNQQSLLTNSPLVHATSVLSGPCVCCTPLTASSSSRQPSHALRSVDKGPEVLSVLKHVTQLVQDTSELVSGPIW